MAGDQPDHQQTQLDGASVPAPAQPPAGPDVSYQPTATAFPAQGAPGAADNPAPGAPVGPYDPQAAAGYGYPQPAPAQSGYGTPQAGYGQPGPANGPGPVYAYPQPQAQPQPNYYPGPPQGAPQPPAKQRNPVMVFGAIAGTVLTIGIVIGLIVLFTPSPHHGSTAGSTSGTSAGQSGGPSGPGGSTDALSASWTAPKPADSSSDHRLLGVWTTDKLVIRGDAQALTAYNQSNGQVAWTLPAPSGTKAFCSMSRDTNSNNLGAVSFNLGDDDCAGIGAVDATSGKLLFNVGQPLSQGKSFDTAVTVTDTSIAAASGSLLAGFSITDGHQLWSYKPRGQFCNDNADAAGNVVVVSDFCADGSPTQVLQVLDANTGKSSTSITLNNENDRINQIVSVKPLVLQISSDNDADYMVELDGSGNPGTKIPLKVTGQDKLQLSSASAPEAKDVVIGNTIYVQVEQNSHPAVEAIDLGTGKMLWTSDGGAAQGLRLVDKSSVTNPAVIAIDGYDKGARLGNLSTTDGSFTAIAPFNKKDLGFMSFSDTEVLMSKDTKSVLTVQGLPIENTVQMFNRK